MPSKTRYPYPDYYNPTKATKPYVPDERLDPPLFGNAILEQDFWDWLCRIFPDDDKRAEAEHYLRIRADQQREKYDGVEGWTWHDLLVDAREAFPHFKAR